MAISLGQLERMEVRGFKSIRSLDLPLTALNVLIGPNGSGKSNFIGVFRLLNKIVEKDLQSYIAEQGGADRLLHFGRKRTEELSISLQFRPNSYSCTLQPTAEGRLFFSVESCGYDPSQDPIRQPKEGEHEKVLFLANPGDLETALPAQPSHDTIKGYVTSYLQSWKVYHFHDTSESAAIKASQPIDDVDRLRPDARNLAAFLLSIQDTPEYKKIVATIQRVAPFFHDFILKPDPRNPDRLRLRWKHRGTDDYFDVSSLSDGTLRFICLATLLLQPSPPKTLLLDEPELGLHPFAIHLLGGLLRKASKRSQVILSTQSVTLANQFTCEDIIVADRDGDESVFRRLGQEDLGAWLQDYGIGDLWEKNLLGGTPK